MQEGGFHGLPRWEPTADEIAAETARIRATWLSAERRRRCRCAYAESVRAAEVHLDEGEGDFT